MVTSELQSLEGWVEHQLTGIPRLDEFGHVDPLIHHAQYRLASLFDPMGCKESLTKALLDYDRNIIKCPSRDLPAIRINVETRRENQGHTNETMSGGLRDRLPSLVRASSND